MEYVLVGVVHGNTRKGVICPTDKNTPLVGSKVFVRTPRFNSLGEILCALPESKEIPDYHAKWAKRVFDGCIVGVQLNV